MSTKMMVTKMMMTEMMMMIDDDDDAHFLREMMLTRANSMREKKMKQVQTRNQMSMNLM